jgi:hypothetical protein
MAHTDHILHGRVNLVEIDLNIANGAGTLLVIAHYIIDGRSKFGRLPAISITGRANGRAAKHDFIR